MDAAMDAAPGSAGPPRTTAGTVVGTPAYMSPEQALGEEVSPASDIYSLGLILQFLFTGIPARPTDLTTMELLQRAGRGESRKIEGVPADIAALIRAMKSFGPGDRPSASAVAQRLGRIRSKAKRRLRWAAAAVLAAAAAGAGVKYTVDLRHERAQARTAQAEAETARDQAEAVNEFLVTLLGSASPGETLGQEVTVRQVLDRAAAELPLREDLDSDAKVRFLMIVGNVYRDLGLFDGARSVLEVAVELADREGPVEARIDAQARIELGMLELTDGSLEAARRHYLRAAEIVEQRMTDNLQARFVALGGLGHVYAREGRLDAAREAYGDALGLIRRVKPPGDPQIGLALGNLGYIMMEQGDWEAASDVTSEALEIFEVSLGPDHPVVARAANNLANCQGELGRLEEAYSLHGRVVGIRERVLGPDHPDTAQALANLAGVAAQLKRFDEAEERLDRAAAIVTATHGEDHPERIHVLLVQAELAEARGDLESAESLARDAYGRAVGLEGIHAVLRDAEARLIGTLITNGKPTEALAVAEDALERRMEVPVPDQELVGDAWFGVAKASWAVGDAGRTRGALEAAREAGFELEAVTEPGGLAELAHEVAAGASL
jgi:tetratricopeptide (TPR) repeat protein